MKDRCVIIMAYCCMLASQALGKMERALDKAGHRARYRISLDAANILDAQHNLLSKAESVEGFDLDMQIARATAEIKRRARVESRKLHAKALEHKAAYTKVRDLLGKA